MGIFQGKQMTDVMPTSVLRRLAERILGRMVVVRRLPAVLGHGKIVVSGRIGGLKYLLKSPDQWDPELIRIAAALVRPGDRVWDVGANVGLFAVAAAHYGGANSEVVAIEADHDAVSLLFATNRRANPRFTVLPVAIGERTGFVRFAIARRARAANAIDGYGSTQTGGVSEVRILPSFALDDLLESFPPPSVVKIDVEGAELAVLSGAKRLLREFKPRIYCEVTDRTRDSVSVFLRQFGYAIYDGESFGTAGVAGVGDKTSNLVALVPAEG